MDVDYYGFMDEEEISSWSSVQVRWCYIPTKANIDFEYLPNPEASNMTNSSTKEPSIAASIYLFIHLYSCSFVSFSGILP